MNFIKLYCLLSIVFVIGLKAQNRGINTNNPTKALDVNGELRIRVLPLGNGTQQVIVSDQDGNMLKAAVPKAVPVIGDIKDGYSETDHDGWYLLNGRALTTLSSTSQINASSLGFTGNLPNFSGRYSKMASPAEVISSVTGNISYNLAKVNLPNFTMTANTNYIGGHTHTLEDQRPGHYPPAAGAGLRGLQGTGTIMNSGEDDVTSTNGAHTHTVTLSSNGGGQPFALTPSYIALNTFIYLGN